MGAAKRQAVAKPRSSLAARTPAPLRPRPAGGRGMTVGAVRESLGLTRRLFSRLTGLSERLLADLEPRALAELSAGQQRRMIEAQRLSGALQELVRPEAAARWLTQPNAALDGFKPLEVVERGEMDRLWGLLFRARGGLPA